MPIFEMIWRWRPAKRGVESCSWSHPVAGLFYEKNQPVFISKAATKKPLLLDTARQNPESKPDVLGLVL
jgi:hypothetical protein